MSKKDTSKHGVRLTVDFQSGDTVSLDLVARELEINPIPSGAKLWLRGGAEVADPDSAIDVSWSVEFANCDFLFDIMQTKSMHVRFVGLGATDGDVRVLQAESLPDGVRMSGQF